MGNMRSAVSRTSAGKAWRSTAIALALSAVGFLAAPSAQAQNLVQNPNFLNGLSGYQSLGTPFNIQTTQNPNFNLAVLAPGSILTQSIQTNIGVNYLISFYTSFANTAMFHDQLFASFGDGGVTLDSQSGATAGLYSFSATATDTTSTLRFGEGTGGVNLLTALDVEAAPAPVPGAGMLSAIAALAGLLGIGRRNRKSALR